MISGDRSGAPSPGGSLAAAGGSNEAPLLGTPPSAPRQARIAVIPPQDLADDDWRKTNLRLTEDNFKKNLRIVDEVKAVASELESTPAQVALAWLLAQGDDIAPIPGTKRVTRVEENTAADGIKLSAERLERLNHLTPAAGERHEEANMAAIDR